MVALLVLATICRRPVTLTFDLLTLKSMWESHVTWGTPVQSFVFLGLLVFEFEPMYATSDGRRTPITALCPLGGGIINVTNIVFYSSTAECLFIIRTASILARSHMCLLDPAWSRMMSPPGLQMLLNLQRRRPLTPWLPKLIVSCPCPVDYLCEFEAKSVVHPFSK